MATALSEQFLIAGVHVQTKTLILVPSFLLMWMRGFTSHNNVTKKVNKHRKR